MITNYIDRERFEHEAWEERQKENQIKEWFVIYKDDKLIIDFNCRFDAEKFYSEKKFVDPKKDMEIGWVWSHNVCNDYDRFMEDFNPIMV